MTLPVVLAIAGCVALLVGLFGGGVKAKEVEVPKIPSGTRVLSGLIGVLLIGVASWFTYAIPPLPSNTTPSPTVSAMATLTNVVATSTLATEAPPTQIVPTSIVGSTRKVIGNYDIKDIWFISPLQLIQNYVLESTDQPYKEDFERLVSYSRLYRHPSDCQSTDVRGVSLQVIFFKSDAGSRTYFTNAFAEAENTNTKIVYSVGETSYFRSYSQNDAHCNDQVSDKYLLLFQRYNAIGIVTTWIVPGSMRDNDVEEWLNQIGTKLDSTFEENAN